MSHEKIIEFNRELIGHVYPMAESRYDEISKDNANRSYEIISHLIADIGVMASENIDSNYGSCFECAKNGVKILKNLKREIETYLYEIGAEE